MCLPFRDSGRPHVYMKRDYILLGVILVLLFGIAAWNILLKNSIPASGGPHLPAGSIDLIGKDMEEIAIPDQATSSSDEVATDTITETIVKKHPAAEVLIENLTIPWDIGFLPNGNLLITERDGTLIEFDLSSGTSTVHDITSAAHIGEGGLLGLALHPDFKSNRYLYLYVTTNLEGRTISKVLRYRYAGEMLSNGTTIVDNIPGAFFHDGGRMAFGPDGKLYITTGDAQDPSLSQDVTSLAGKILRVNDDGTAPADNPFVSQGENAALVYSYGHRNPQGLAWDNAGVLWATEHGRSGALSGLDEINLIIRGGNYGWPNSQGDVIRENTVGPVIHSGDVTWAPAGAAYYDGSLFFGGLRGETLYEAVIDGVTIRALKTHFAGRFGRIRAVVLGPDNLLYITTSNRDGRGTVQEGDDKVIRIDPKQLQD